MPVQVLRATVQRKIESDLGRSKVHRAGECVVDHRDKIVRAGELHDTHKVRHLHERVRDGLDVDSACVRLELASPIFGIASIDKTV